MVNAIPSGERRFQAQIAPEPTPPAFEVRCKHCPNPDCFDGHILNSPWDPSPVLECPVCQGAGHIEVIVPAWQREWEAEPVWAC